MRPMQQLAGRRILRGRLSLFNGWTDGVHSLACLLNVMGPAFWVYSIPGLSACRVVRAFRGYGAISAYRFMGLAGFPALGEKTVLAPTARCRKCSQPVHATKTRHATQARLIDGIRLPLGNNHPESDLAEHHKPPVWLTATEAVELMRPTPAPSTGSPLMVETRWAVAASRA